MCVCLSASHASRLTLCTLIKALFRGWWLFANHGYLTNLDTEWTHIKSEGKGIGKDDIRASRSRGSMIRSPFPPVALIRWNYYWHIMAETLSAYRIYSATSHFCITLPLYKWYGIQYQHKNVLANLLADWHWHKTGSSSLVEDTFKRVGWTVLFVSVKCACCLQSTGARENLRKHYIATALL